MNPCICIPVYNNPSTVESVILDCLMLPTSYPIIVYDDGSTIPVLEILQSSKNYFLIKNRCVFLRNNKNNGKGYALQCLFNQASQLGYTHAITIDADGQHFAKDISSLVSLTKENPNHLIIGARNMNRQNSPLISRVGRYMADSCVKFITGKELFDSQSGMRIYPLNQTLKISFQCRKYDFEMESLIKLLLTPCMAKFSLIEVYYPARKNRVSHFHLFSDNARIIKLCFSIWISKLIHSALILIKKIFPKNILSKIRH